MCDGTVMHGSCNDWHKLASRLRILHRCLLATKLCCKVFRQLWYCYSSYCVCGFSMPTMVISTELKVYLGHPV